VLVHKFGGVRVLVSLERVLFLFTHRIFQRFILLSVRQLPDNLINTINGKRNRRSGPNLMRRSRSKSEQVRRRAYTSQVPSFSTEELFPSNLLSLFFVLWFLNCQSQLLRGEPAGAHTPQIHCQLAGQSDDGFFARGARGECAFGQTLFPFAHGAVMRLEADHSPG